MARRLLVRLAMCGVAVCVLAPAAHASSAIVVTQPATNVGENSATLNGSIDPGGGPPVFKCFFEYGSDSSYGGFAPCQPEPPFEAPTAVTADLAGLQSGHTYHYRLVGVVSEGEPPEDQFVVGADSSFCTGSPSCSGGGGSTAPGPSPERPVTTPNRCSPSSPPRAVVILITGIGSELPPTPPYNPLQQSYCGLATRQGGALSALETMARGTFDDRSDGPVTPLDFTDALAATGAVLLPFSYGGSTLSGSAKHPLYRAVGFDDNVPGAVLPSAEADTYLRQLVSEAHGLWPGAPIVVIGHSEGGLVAEQLFERHAAAGLPGVARIISLDSPIGGVAHDLGPFNFNAVTHISQPLFDFWNQRWQERTAISVRLISLERRTGQLFRPFGTPSDRVYTLGDFPCSGLESQLIWYVRLCGSQGPTPLGYAVFSAITPEPATSGTPRWPSFGGFLGLNSHDFVVESHDDIAAIAEEVERAIGHVPLAASLRAPRAEATSDLLPGSDSGSEGEVAYAPSLVAHLERPIALPGGAIAIAGSGLGEASGSATLVDGASATPLQVERWTPTGIVALLPPGAPSGVVSVTTAAGQTAFAGFLGVVEEPHNDVRRLLRLPGGRAFDGEPAKLVLEARGRNGEPLRGAVVQLLAEDGIWRAVTDALGRATFRIQGYGCQHAVAFSGKARSGLGLCWRRPPGQSLAVKVRSQPTSTLVLARVSAHGPVAGQAVDFRLTAPRCAHLGRHRTRTDVHGVATTRVSNRCRAPVAVEAATDHGALSRSVLVAPRKRRRASAGAGR